MLKEDYLVNISAQEILDKLNKEARLKIPEKRFIDDSALLVLDMQKYFTEPGSHAFVPSSRHIIEPTNNLINYYSKRRRPIIFTRHINDKNNASNMKSWWRDLITAENPLSAYTDELLKEQSIDLIKTQYDAFFKTELENKLLNLNIKNLVLCGVMTHLCLESTARSAFIRGFNVVIPVDTTATYYYELHYSSLRALAHGFSFITTSGDLKTSE